VKFLASYLRYISLGKNDENQLRVLDQSVCGKPIWDLRGIRCGVARFYWA
jgi:hypothetical protein